MEAAEAEAAEDTEAAAASVMEAEDADDNRKKIRRSVLSSKRGKMDSTGKIKYGNT